MRRFILRLTGEGSAPPSDVAKNRSTPGLTTLDSASSRMLLVQTSNQAVEQLTQALPGWIFSPEQTIPLPDPKPKIRI